MSKYKNILWTPLDNHKSSYSIQTVNKFESASRKRRDQCPTVITNEYKISLQLLYRPWNCMQIETKLLWIPPKITGLLWIRFPKSRSWPLRTRAILPRRQSEHADISSRSCASTGYLEAVNELYWYLWRCQICSFMNLVRLINSR